MDTAEETISKPKFGKTTRLDIDKLINGYKVTLRDVHYNSEEYVYITLGEVQAKVAEVYGE